jgi:zinc transport system substrate-binding protein
MKINWRWKTVCLPGLLLMFILLGGQTGAEASEKSKISVTIPPQAYFAEQIGGEFVDVSVLIEPGRSPETFEPSVKQMAALSETDGYIPIGLPFETVLTNKLKELMPQSKIFYCLPDAVRNRLVYPMQNRREHLNHDHGEPDPHVWLDPIIAKIICKNICNILQNVDSNHTDYFENNLRSINHDLDSINSYIAARLQPYKGREFFVFHPAFGYFARRYELIQTSVEFEGKEPGAKQLAELIDRAKKKNIRTVFVQKQFSQKSARAIADAINGDVASIDPLEYDYLNNLINIAEALVRGFEKK